MTKLGFQILNAGPLATRENVVEAARRAEALGYESIVVTDHIVIPRRIESRYPYNATGRLFVKRWTEENPTFEGTHYQVRDIGCFPKPLQTPHPPIFVGGNSHAAIRRATRYGQSWHAFRMPVEELRARVGYLRAQVGASGRPADACGFSVRYGIRVVGPRGDAARREPEEPGRVLVGTAAQVIEQLEPIVDLGPTHAIFDCRSGSQ